MVFFFLLRRSFRRKPLCGRRSPQYLNAQRPLHTALRGVPGGQQRLVVGGDQVRHSCALSDPVGEVPNLAGEVYALTLRRRFLGR
jgi:hypothetical protein